MTNTDIVIAMLRPDHQQLATKDDLAVTRAELKSEMAAMQAAIERRITDGFQHQIRSMILTIMGAVVLLMLADALRGVVA